ncbi:MAG: phosphotransferase [Proteobacteria bacterium]|nr:phosphotransferase [Pseudomonadota bacterium]
MEKRIRDRYNDTILQQAVACYAISPNHIRLLDGFESYIYEFERDDGEFILRIGHSFRRNKNLVLGEVDWINYLAAAGVSVARAIPSQSGQVVEFIDDGRNGQFLVTAFIKAPGRPVWEAGWTDALYKTYGRLVGRMHALSKTYAPADTAWTRPRWDDPINMDMAQYLPDSESKAAAFFADTVAYLQSLPENRDSYGLIHQDAHAGNFFVDGQGAITLFDFDDCVYGHFIYDIAMVVFYMLVGVKDAVAYTRAFLPLFLRGYTSQNSLDPAWLAELPTFLKLREIDLYALIHRSFDLDNLDDPWTIGYMQGRKARIDNNVPFVDFDFTELADTL